MKEITIPKIREKLPDSITATYFLSRFRKKVPYIEKIAQAVGAREFAEKVFGRDNIRRFGWYMVPMTYLRHQSITDRLKEEGMKNIIEVDGRINKPKGLVLTENEGVKYLAIDSPEFIAETQDVMEAVGGSRENLVYMQNPNKPGDLKGIRAAADRLGREPIGISLDMILGHTTPIVQDDVLRNSYDVLTKYSGVLVTIDFVDMETRKQITDMLGPKFEAARKKCFDIVRRTRPVMGLGFPENYKDAADLIREYGFSFERYPMWDGKSDIDPLGTVPVDLKPKIEEIFSKMMYVWVLRPKK